MLVLASQGFLCLLKKAGTSQALGGTVHAGAFSFSPYDSPLLFVYTAYYIYIYCVSCLVAGEQSGAPKMHGKKGT